MFTSADRQKTRHKRDDEQTKRPYESATPPAIPAYPLERVVIIPRRRGVTAATAWDCTTDDVTEPCGECPACKNRLAERDSKTGAASSALTRLLP